MAIWFDKQPAAAPVPIEFPAQVRVTQVLATDSTHELAEITYEVVGPDGVLIEEAGRRSGLARRRQRVTRGSATLEHRLRLVRTAAAAPVVSVQIRVTLVDESQGRQRRTLALAVEP